MIRLYLMHLQSVQKIKQPTQYLQHLYSAFPPFWPAPGGVLSTHSKLTTSHYLRKWTTVGQQIFQNLFMPSNSNSHFFSRIFPQPLDKGYIYELVFRMSPDIYVCCIVASSSLPSFSALICHQCYTFSQVLKFIPYGQCVEGCGN